VTDSKSNIEPVVIGIEPVVMGCDFGTSVDRATVIVVVYSGYGLTADISVVCEYAQSIHSQLTDDLMMLKVEEIDADEFDELDLIHREFDTGTAEHMFEHVFVPPMQRQCNLIRCRSPGNAETIHDVHKPRGTIRAVFSCRAGSMYGRTGNVSLIACNCVLAMKFFPCFGGLQ